jgi:hypothetical protein
LAEDALGDKEALVRGAAAKALGAFGSPESIPKLQNLLADEDILVALAVGHALVQLKINSGYDVYYFLVVGVRKGRTSPITEELNQMKTSERADGGLPRLEEKKHCANAGCRRTGIGRRPGPARRPRACESSVRQRLECRGGSGGGNRQARGSGPAGEHRACNVRQVKILCAILPPPRFFG